MAPKVPLGLAAHTMTTLRALMLNDKRNTNRLPEISEGQEWIYCSGSVWTPYSGLFLCEAGGFFSAPQRRTTRISRIASVPRCWLRGVGERLDGRNMYYETLPDNQSGQ